MNRHRRRWWTEMPWGVMVLVGILLVVIAGIALAAVYAGGTGQ